MLHNPKVNQISLYYNYNYSTGTVSQVISMKRMINRNRNSKGFTLSELLIVAAIIVVLAGISIPTFSQEIKKAKYREVVNLEISAKEAATAAFYAGTDSLGNKVDFSSGVCTFLYDAENNSVYVLNSACDAMDFWDQYTYKGSNYLNGKIEGYGSEFTCMYVDPTGTILAGNVGAKYDYKDYLILVQFDARYHDGKGSFEQPVVTMRWDEGVDSIHSLLA